MHPITSHSAMQPDKYGNAPIYLPDSVLLYAKNLGAPFADDDMSVQPDGFSPAF